MLSGDAGTARRLCLEILEEAPDHVGALRVLAGLSQADGAVDVAITLLRRIQRLMPDDLAVSQELAGLLLGAKRTAEAEAQARNAVRLAPEAPTSHSLLAMALTDGHQPHAGEFHYRQALALAGPDAVTLSNLAWNLKLQGRVDEARTVYREATAFDPSILLTWLGWALTEEAGRNLEEAARLVARVRRLDPAHDIGTIEATLLARRGEWEAALVALRGAAQRPGGPGSDGLLETARVLDRLGRHDEAFAAMMEAKALTRQAGYHYAAQAAAELTTRLAGFFTASRLRLLPRPETEAAGPQPVFIVGAPRSGTTLVEQILSAHPAVAAGDELPALDQVAAMVPQMLASPLAYPEALSELWMGDQRDGLTRLRDEYLRRARRLVTIGPGNRLFTDKMPFNELHLGLTALMFPTAPVVHVLRHPLDVVLSMMAHNLTHGFNCAGDLETAARHCRRMLELVAHYRQNMLLRYLPLRYEDLVQDFEPNVRRLLGFAGLRFDRRCLRFDENRRYARTASYAQVTERLYSRSLYRYRAYMRHLEPVVPILEPVIDSLGYSV
ncbi:tetratricopeptide repeat-containing sulfotransferase family protein [Azospirillum picis]|uniref:Flp pilus assembly protein TadD n=1 Tax=Azospirillum picis TaxID=488438 RepID=A0ABU0MMT9_9PROT|nr:tetratricopeptide repeat-containing sulfotransferase family protein [Azospirillum picis]MBP2303585.1 Flp pilus assembly protein TadD [Azospirillum picis]MDQ0534788.1 Flp pilus assembly protein TadD [Azospirillum picis]